MPSSQQWDCPDRVAIVSPGVSLPWRRELHMESIRKRNEDRLASLEPKQGSHPQEGSSGKT